MAKGIKKLLHAYIMAQSMFCAIPFPCVWDEEARSWMLPCLPAVGLVIGGLWYGLWRAMEALRLPAPLGAALLAVLPYLATGFLHLDGFLDTSDALLSRRPLEEKLRILKDPHTGAFAIVSLGVLLLVCYGAALSILQAGGEAGPLLLVPVLSRSLSASFVLFAKPLETSQYSGGFRDRRSAGQRAAVLTACALAMGGLLALWGLKGLWAMLFCAAGQTLSTSRAIRQLGGMSGDLSGYGLTIGEACALAALAVF